VMLCEVAVPDGYTAVLRAVEVEVTQPLLIGTSDPGTSFFQLDLLREGAVIPNNTTRFRSSFAFYRWETHQVYGAWETMGIRGTFSLPIVTPNPLAVELTGTARFFGTLIPSRSLPPTEEIASGPVVTQEVKLAKETP